MAVCTYSDVFELCGTPSDVQTTQQSAVTSLIANVTAEIEAYIGRKIESTTITNQLFHHNLNCEIYKEILFLTGKYRDLYSITSIYENNVELSAVTDYDDGNDYYLDTKLGALIRKNRHWSREEFAIKITGAINVGKAATVDKGIKQICVEIVAARSGLWKHSIETEGGRIDQVRTTPTKATLDRLDLYKAKDL